MAATDAAKAKFASGAGGWLVAYSSVNGTTVLTNCVLAIWEKMGCFSHKNVRRISMHSVKDKIVARIYGKGRGWVFTPISFLDLGTRRSVDEALSLLAKARTVRHLARGLYDYPASHHKLGVLSAQPDAIAQALSESESTRLQPSGAYAVNLLGLSQQVPAKYVYLTDGASKNVRVGNQEIQLKQTTPKNMKTAGRTSGLVIQAFRYLKKDGVTLKVVDHLKRILSADDKAQLWKDRVHAPAWMHGHFEKIANG